MRPTALPVPSPSRLATAVLAAAVALLAALAVVLPGHAAAAEPNETGLLSPGLSIIDAQASKSARTLTVVASVDPDATGQLKLKWKTSKGSKTFSQAIQADGTVRFTVSLAAKKLRRSGTVTVSYAGTEHFLKASESRWVPLAP